MEINLAEKLKSIRKEKNVSQEKLAEYLNVSFQAVSRWETGGAYPDISLLPDIARFFGITVDELLQAEKLDEKKLYQEYEDRCAELWRNGQGSQALALWEEAYHKMPNNVDVKEMLMSSYFDIDKEKYRNEIIELGTELYNSDIDHYYKGQAIQEIALLYAEEGDIEMAKRADGLEGRRRPVRQQAGHADAERGACLGVLRFLSGQGLVCSAGKGGGGIVGLKVSLTAYCKTAYKYIDNLRINEYHIYCERFLICRAGIYRVI